METTTREGRLNPRARRALPLIAASVLVATWASVAYLQPSLLRLPQPAQPARAPRPAVLSSDYAATYAFLTPSLGWALVTETTTLTPRFSVFKTTDAAGHWKRQFLRQLNVISLDTFIVRFFDRSGTARIPRERVGRRFRPPWSNRRSRPAASSHDHRQHHLQGLVLLPHAPR